jgi:Fe-S-cluster containining protein
MPSTVAVPCGSCRLCCINQQVVLHPEQGDDPAAYDCERILDRMTGQYVTVLKQKPNRECIHLGPKGCEIYERRPAMCRNYDCGALYRRMRPREREEAVRRGLVDTAMLNAGRRVAQYQDAVARGENPAPPFGTR